MIRPLSDEALRHRLGASAAASCRKRFGPERLISNVQRVYEEVVTQQDPVASDEANASGSLAVLEACRRRSVHVVAASSSSS